MESTCLDDASENDSWSNVDLSVMIRLRARPGHAHCIEQLCRQGSSRWYPALLSSLPQAKALENMSVGGKSL